MKYSKLLIGLFLFTSTLLIIDILTGIFYWNRLNLSFDSSEFNNISTPIIATASFIVYSLALFLAFKQNKTILSQHLRPYYEREIDKIVSDLENEKINTELIDTHEKEYNRINYPNLLFSQLAELSRNSDYLKDIEAYEKGTKFNATYIKKRSYFPITLFLSQFMTGLFNKIKYDYIKELIEEIDKSKLLEDDKFFLKRRIKKETLTEYISFIKFEKTSSTITPPVPNLLDYKTQDNIAFKKISDSNFNEHYNWFETNLR
ncbi:MAG: hypothetical protein R2819_14365 [Allomuricauda sp.]